MLLNKIPQRTYEKVKYKCDCCGDIREVSYGNFKQQEKLHPGIHRCVNCSRSIQCTRMTRSGENHGRWNPDKGKFKEYANQVRYLTEKNYNKYKEMINPNNLPRMPNGTINGYQLDHIISVKKGFEDNISPAVIASPSNLQTLPWHINRQKWS